MLCLITVASSEYRVSRLEFINDMKKITSIALLILISLGVNAQGDKKAKDILNGASSKYRSYKSMKADFSYTLENPTAKIKETQNGTIILSGAKYKLAISGQEIICDGKTIWTYIKPNEILTMYEKGFLYKSVDEKKVGNKVQQNLELTPTDKSKNFFKLKLTVDKSSKQIVKSVIFEKSGNRYTYAIKEFTPNFATSAGTFTFDPKKYPGVEVVDLR